MVEGKITFIGFEVDEAEKAIIDNLISSYKHKISQITDYNEIKLRLKKRQHGKAWMHEVHGTLITGQMFTAKVEDYNLFAAISEVFEKLINEIKHKQRTNRQ